MFMFQTNDIKNRIVYIDFQDVFDVVPFSCQGFNFNCYSKILFNDDSEVIIKEDFNLISNLFKEYKKNV